MSIQERIALCLLLEKVNNDKNWCRDQGISDASHMKE